VRLGISIGIGWGALALVALIGPIAWQQYAGATSPEVTAIKSRPIPTTATVVEPVIDGFGGDPALTYRYSVSGRTYDGFDLANEKTGDVLGMKPGDAVSIVYAATMPSVSCLVGSTDCPNDVYDPAIPAFAFWAILVAGSFVTAMVVGAVLIARVLRRRRLTT
jgi:hypothetical protein